MKKALITGASGYLAHRLLPVAAEHTQVTGVCRNPPDSTSSAASFVALDITDAEATRNALLQFAPDVIIHAAAANPGCSDDEMWAVNAGATNVISEIAATLNSRLVFVSTDIVHNGACAPYPDNAAPDPINAYGKSKAAGESAVLSYPRGVVARTSLIYGLEQMDRGTAGFVDALTNGRQLTLFDNVLRQPVWIDSLCHALCALAFEQTAETGVINVAGEQPLSRADFGRKMLHHWQAPNTDTIQIASAGDGVPLDCRMHLDRARALGFALPGVDEVLGRH